MFFNYFWFQASDLPKHKFQTNTKITLCLNILTTATSTFNIQTFEFQARFLDALQQRSVVDGFLLDAWEEIRHDAPEQLQVVDEELGHVDVPDGPQADQVLGHLRVLSLQVSCRDCDTSK